MNHVFKRIGLILILFWLIGVAYRFFIEKPSAGIQYYKYIDGIIDGSLVLGIILLFISVFSKKKDIPTKNKKKDDFQNLIEQPDSVA